MKSHFYSRSILRIVNNLNKLVKCVTQFYKIYNSFRLRYFCKFCELFSVILKYLFGSVAWFKYFPAHLIKSYRQWPLNGDMLIVLLRQLK